MMKPAIRCVADIRPRFATRYTCSKRWVMPPLRAANDNQPSQATDPMAARRALLDSISEWSGRTVKAWPTSTRLVRARRVEDLDALRRWRDRTAPPRLIAANDNEPELDEDGEPVAPSLDCVMESQPSANRLYACWSRASVTRRIDGTIERAPAGKPAVTVLAGGDAIIRVGDLRFDNGRLVRFRSGDMWIHPSDTYGAAKGAASDEDAVASSMPVEPMTGDAAESEVIRSIDAKSLRKRLGEEESAVLDWACTGATTAQIALAVRGTAPGKYAERLGAKLVDDAIQKFREIEAEDVPSRVSGGDID